MDIISPSATHDYCILREHTGAMKYLLVLCVVVATVLADEKYVDKYDNINLKEILGNKRLLQAYVDCIMERGKCSPEGKELKEHLQDAFTNGCEKCTKAQEEGATTVIEHLMQHELAIWHEVTAKVDPDGKWKKEYESRARAKGITIPE